MQGQLQQGYGSMCKKGLGQCQKYDTSWPNAPLDFEALGFSLPSL